MVRGTTACGGMVWPGASARSSGAIGDGVPIGGAMVNGASGKALSPGGFSHRDHILAAVGTPVMSRHIGLCRTVSQCRNCLIFNALGRNTRQQSLIGRGLPEPVRPISDAGYPART